MSTNQTVILRIGGIIESLAKARGAKLELTSEFIEIIVLFNENTEVRANEDVAKQMEFVWDVLSTKADFVTQYNTLKKTLLTRRQLRKEENKMQAIKDPQA